MFGKFKYRVIERLHMVGTMRSIFSKQDWEKSFIVEKLENGFGKRKLRVLPACDEEMVLSMGEAIPLLNWRDRLENHPIQGAQERMGG